MYENAQERDRNSLFPRQHHHRPLLECRQIFSSRLRNWITIKFSFPHDFVMFIISSFYSLSRTFRGECWSDAERRKTGERFMTLSNLDKQAPTQLETKTYLSYLSYHYIQLHAKTIKKL